MSRVAVICTDNVEEVECLTVVDFLRRAGVTVDMVSRTGKLEICGAHQITFLADILLDDLMDKEEELMKHEGYDGIILPGGAGWESLSADYRVRDAALTFAQEKKLVAAICAAPGILAKIGLLKGRRATIYPGMELDDLEVQWMDKGVVQSDNIITGQGPAKAAEFAIALVGYLEGRGKEAEIRDQVVLEYR